METARSEEFYVTADRTEALVEFERLLGQKHFLGEWMVQRRKGHQTGGVPFLWRAEETRQLLDQAGEVLTLEKGARRSLLFLNPEIPQGTTMALRVGVQMMNPHEVGIEHRHAINALRFVIDGHPDAYTVVNGEKLVMNDNDLILTPSFCWHHHENHSDKEVLWLDAVDAPLLTNLNVYFFELHPEGRPPILDDAERARHRVGWVRPSWEQNPFRNNPAVGVPIAYPWSQVREQLEALRRTEGSPYDGVILEYVNPITGGPALSTIDCHVQMLRPGERTASHRHTSGTVYHVIDGEGVTVAGDVTLHWKKGDQFVVPSWCWHEHRNLSSEGDALLFSVSDAPILKALHLYREETR